MVLRLACPSFLSVACRRAIVKEPSQRLLRLPHCERQQLDVAHSQPLEDRN